MKHSIQRIITIVMAMTVVAVISCSLRNDAANKAPGKSPQLQDTRNNNGFALVELYTSEGCSSCPPADRLMEKLQRENAGKPVYLLAFHVDYWDHLGWKDKFSASEFTARQRRYAGWMKLESIYTPQVVVNGASECVGSNEQSIDKAITDALGRGTDNTVTLKNSLENGQLKVTYTITGSTNNKALYLALVQKAAHSNVLAGENKGRTLSHVQIVRQLTQVNIQDNGSATMPLPADLNKEAWELIAFVQQTGNGSITAAIRAD
jgi:hypothetical protein